MGEDVILVQGIHLWCLLCGADATWNSVYLERTVCCLVAYIIFLYRPI